MSEESIIEKYGWKSYIGKELDTRTGEPVLAKDIRHFALAIDDPNPIYYDEEAAKKSKYGGMVAPPEYVFWATHNANMEARVKDLKEDGLVGRGAFLGTPELPNMWTLGFVRGGDDWEFYEPVRVGDTVTVRWKITDVYEKEAKSGQLVFIKTEHDFTNQNGKLLARQRVTTIGMPRKG